MRRPRHTYLTNHNYLLGHNIGGNISRVTRRAVYFRLKRDDHVTHWRVSLQEVWRDFDVVRAYMETDGSKSGSALLCCRCCQAPVDIFFPLPVLGTVSPRPEPSGDFGWHTASPHPCPSTHTSSDTVDTACPVPTADMRAILSDLRWKTVRGHLLDLTLAHARDRST